MYFFLSKWPIWCCLNPILKGVYHLFYHKLTNHMSWPLLHLTNCFGGKKEENNLFVIFFFWGGGAPLFFLSLIAPIPPSQGGRGVSRHGQLILIDINDTCLLILLRHNTTYHILLTYTSLFTLVITRWQHQFKDFYIFWFIF